YDADSNWIADVAADWTFVNDKGSFNASVNSVSAATSVTFNAEVTTSAADHAVIRASFGGDTDDTGTTVAGIEINVGAQASIKINDAAGAGGSELDTNTLTADQTDLLYASSYDADSNWIADVAADWIFVNDKGSFNASVNSVSAATSVTFNADVTTSAADHAVIRASFGGHTDDTGTTVAGIEINVGAQASIKINDAAGSGGSELDTNTLTTDQTDLLYASSYDGDSNWIADVAADWTFVNDKGSFNASVNSVSAATSVTFNADVTTSAADHAVIRASFGGDTDDTGTTVAGIEINVGAQASIQINDAAGSGGSELDTNTLTTDQTDLLYASSYDADSNWIADVAADWTFVNDKGTFNASVNSVSAATSVTFNADVTTSAADHAVIRASFGGDTDDTGTAVAGIEINVGAQASIKINDAAGSGGSELDTNTLTADQTDLLYASSYDGDSNWIANVAADWTFVNDKGSFNASVNSVSAATSVTFNADVTTVVADHAVIRASFGGDTDDTGTTIAGIEISAGAQATVRINDVSGSGGVAKETNNMTADDSITLHGAAYDSDGNYISNPSGTWTFTNDKGSFLPGSDDNSETGASVTFYANQATIAADHCVINFSSGGDNDDTGTVNAGFEITAGALVNIRVESKSDGSGNVFTTGEYFNDVTSGTTMTLFSVGYDADSNYKGTESATWTFNSSGNQTSSNGVGTIVAGPAVSTTWTVLNVVGADAIIATAGAKSDDTGTMDVGYTAASGDALTNVTDFSIGYYRACAVINTDTVKCWGLALEPYGTSGYLGLEDDTVGSTLIPKTVQIDGGGGDLTNIEQVESVLYGSCAREKLASGGKVYCWGRSQQKGSSDAAKVIKIDAGTDLTNAVDIATGYWGSCAVLNDGTVRCWGSQDDHLGRNFPGSQTYAELVETSVGVSLTNVDKIVVDDRSACALINDGSVTCWGYGSSYRLGNNNVANVGYATAVVLDEAGGNFATSSIHGWGYETMRCGIKADKTVKCWGTGYMGNSTTINEKADFVWDGPSSNITDIVDLGVGDGFGCAVKEGNGTIHCWGNNSAYALGNNGTTNTFLYADQLVKGADGTTPLTKASDVEMGDKNGCALFPPSGILRCWGENDYGVVGNIRSGTEYRYAKNEVISVDSANPTWTDMTTVAEVKVGNNFACARTTGKKVMCWGQNNNCQIGNGEDCNKEYWQVPNDASGMAYVEKTGGVELTNVEEIDLGAWHGCARLTDGSAWCWGYNNYGQLGDNTTSTKNYAVQVYKDAGVTYLDNVTALAVGTYTSCAVISDNTLKCWGYNGSNGLLANGGTTNRYYADVAKIDAGTTLTNVASASVADDLICVVLTDNTAACWGKVFEGVCGDNDAALTKYADTKVLTSIGVETTDIAKIAIGGDHVLALTTANTVRSWGEKYNNNRTGNATDNRPFADEMMESSTGVSFTDASDITGGPWHSCVLKSTDKKVYCVGRNNVLMLGDGSRTQRAWLDSPVVDSALADVTDFTQIDSGANFPTCGVTTGGKVRCWGYGAYGIHVNGSRTEFGSGYTSEIVQRIAP
ncbi:MAG: hypothetical protein HOE90_18350, partial [Bacteriovoracaceae bacterium]|nr:hypothetical protein [Bacteriovoracaceae bacterium]